MVGIAQPEALCGRDKFHSDRQEIKTGFVRSQSNKENRILILKNRNIMNTLNYLHLDEKRVADVVTALHLLLADFQIHYTNLRGFHWDIKGHGFFVLHSKFEDLYNDTAEKIDEIAERILTLGSVPSNKFSDYLKVARIKEISGVTCGSEAVEHILSTYGHLIGEERKVLDLAAEAGDEVTVSLMSDYLKEQEKMVWMLVAYSSCDCKK